MFSGEVITTGQTTQRLEPGIKYTMTLGFPKKEPKVEVAEEIIRQALRNQATILDVQHPLGSDNIILTFEPKVVLGINTTVSSLLNAAFYNAGYKDGRLVRLETGTSSSKPGGLKESVITTIKATGTVVGETTGAALGATIKPLMPWLLLAGVGFLGYAWYKAGGVDRLVRPKQPAGARGYTPPS